MTSASLNKTAKSAYVIWAHRTGNQVAWEYLQPLERQGWMEIVEFLSFEPECHCGETLVCCDCDADVVYECLECGKKISCPACADQAARNCTSEEKPNAATE